MNLWNKLEERGRKQNNLDHTWHLYAVDLDCPGMECELAQCKFAQKYGYMYDTANSAVVNVGYLDIREWDGD